MIKRLLNQTFYVVVIFLLLFIEPAITSRMLLFVQKLYNTITAGTPRLEVIRYLLVGVLLWTGKRLVLFATAVIKSKFVCNIKQDLKHDIFVNLLNLNSASISGLGSTGEYVSLFTNDITIIEQRFFSRIISLISRIFSIAILGSTFVSMEKKLAIPVFLFGVATMFIPSILAKRLNRDSLAYSNSLSRLTQKLKEFLMGYSTIKNYSIENAICQKFNIENANSEQAKFKYDCTLALADSVGSLLAWFSTIMVIGVGLIMVANGEILLGTVIAAQAFAQELGSPLNGLVEDINSIRSLKSIVKKIELLTTEKHEVNTNNSSEEAPGSDSLGIVFKDLSIDIGGKRIVENFSFSFQHGKKYLVIGRNGSGKSSLFKAMKKAFQNYQGDIFINGRNIREISNAELSKLATYLNENVSIFSGSVQENISLWRRITSNEYDNAVAKAHIELDDSREISEDGVDISSGEQRRIEIARSLISNADIMIFDEVVSTLDIETAFDIESAALNLVDKTVIFISHNFSGKLVKEYDEILVMKNGKLVAHGPYDFLLRTNEYFKSICEIKFGNMLDSSGM